ncbi:MAG: CDP-glucose 4,6-dehydratase, partial [Lachnospiraceae bacterium]|nr:CDP-glucose 4,6-dehydratase [Lachnospiraceae bacterium]
VIHMAAQPLVLEGYKDPVGTFSTNVMGTVNLLECVRVTDSVRSVLNVTTDKVYKNREWCWGYREDEELFGRDPYSNSKSCSELVTGSFRDSFFGDMDGRKTAISTARAGNVIGGGDTAENRIIPDAVRAAEGRKKLIVRNPYSVRPYQHVLEPVFAYLMIAAKQFEDPSLSGSYNVGPEEKDCIGTQHLADLFTSKWGEGAAWEAAETKELMGNRDRFHEAKFLKLDSSKIRAVFGWRPRWDIETAVAKTVEFEKCRIHGSDVRQCMEKQIREYIETA